MRDVWTQQQQGGVQSTPVRGVDPRPLESSAGAAVVAGRAAVSGGPGPALTSMTARACEDLSLVDLTAAGVHDFLRAVAAARHAAGPLRVDASGLPVRSSVHLPLVLLLAAARRSRRLGTHLVVVGPLEPLRSALRSAGVAVDDRDP